MIVLAWVVIGVGIVALVSIMWTIVLGSPWTPTPPKRVRRMLDMAEVGPEDVVYDLGSGDGRIVIEAAKRYRARAVGIEADPLRVLWSRLIVALLGLQKQVGIVWGNLFDRGIEEATVVTLFLRQRTNKLLKSKLQRELRPGTRVVSYIWTFEGWSPTKTDPEAQVYVYVMGADNRPRGK